MERIVSVRDMNGHYGEEMVSYETTANAYYPDRDDLQYGEVKLAFNSLEDARQFVVELLEEIYDMEKKEKEAEELRKSLEGERNG